MHENRVKKAAPAFGKWLCAAAVLILALSMGLLSACSGRVKTGVVIAGSTSVQPYAEVLAETYALSHPDGEVDVQGGGSSAGITAVESGAADIGMSSRDLSDKEKNLWYIEMARDGLAVIVHRDNPISDLTIEQVRDIYSAEIADWGELGGGDGKIHVIAREEGSGTRSAFESLVMGEVRISKRAIVQDSNGAVRQLVADDPNSIGFISLGLADETVKALLLNGVAATRENVANETYTLFRPFLYVAAEEPTGLAKQFIDFTLSAEGRKILSDEGLVPSTEGVTE